MTYLDDLGFIRYPLSLGYQGNSAIFPGYMWCEEKISYCLFFTFSFTRNPVYFELFPFYETWDTENNDPRDLATLKWRCDHQEKTCSTQKNRRVDQHASTIASPWRCVLATQTFFAEANQQINRDTVEAFRRHNEHISRAPCGWTGSNSRCRNTHPNGNHPEALSCAGSRQCPMSFFVTADVSQRLMTYVGWAHISCCHWIAKNGVAAFLKETWWWRQDGIWAKKLTADTLAVSGWSFRQPISTSFKFCQCQHEDGCEYSTGAVDSWTKTLRQQNM